MKNSTTPTHSKPSPIMEFPSSLYKYMKNDFVRNKQVELYKEVLKEVNKNGVISDTTMSHVRWYSRVLEYLLRVDTLSLKTKSIITLESPYSGFMYLIGDYHNKSSATIETALLTKPEYVCKLLLWSHTNKVSLNKPIAFYLSVLFSDFYWSYYFHDRIQIPHFFNKMIKFNSEQTPHTAASLLFLKCLDSSIDLESQLDLISQDYQVAFQAAHLFPDLPRDILLFEASLEPQWAYHILVTIKDLPADISGMAKSALQYSPPWLIEYLHASKMFKEDPDTARMLLTESLAVSGHPLVEDLNSALISL